MNVLAIDAVTRYASVAAAEGGDFVFERTWLADRGHAAQIPPVLRQALDSLGGRVDDVVVGLGPGSYTGIRVSLALAKGVARAASARLLGASSLEHAAYNCGAWCGEIRSVISLGAGLVGTGTFRGPWSEWARLTPDEAVSPDSLPLHPDTLLCGPGAQLFHGSITEAGDAGSLVAGGLIRLVYRGGGIARDEYLQPLPNYLRLSTPEERSREIP